MKNCMIYVLLMVTGGATALYAQENVEMIGFVRLKSNVANELQILSYGFGSDYSDGTDADAGEFELPPFLPPGGVFAAWLNRECDDPIFSGDPCRWNTDLRGVPDSVVEAEKTRFSIQYDFSFKRGQGQNISIEILEPWSPYLDSINFSDYFNGVVLNQTITKGNVQIPITNNDLSDVKMTVYYRLPSSSVVLGNAGVLSSRIWVLPNPVHGHGISVIGSLHSGDVITVYDVSGGLVHTVDVVGGRESLRINLPESLSAGIYMVQVRNREGTPVGFQQLVIAQ